MMSVKLPIVKAPQRAKATLLLLLEDVLKVVGCDFRHLFISPSPLFKATVYTQVGKTSSTKDLQCVTLA